MRYFLILFLICGVMVFPGEKMKSDQVVKHLMPETQKEEESVEHPPGKRNPFLDLLKRRTQMGEEKLENLTIEEVNLEGIIKLKSGQFLVLFASSKGKTFLATVGQKLYDGEIVKITINAVTFKKVPPVSLPQK